MISPSTRTVRRKATCDAAVTVSHAHVPLQLEEIEAAPSANRRRFQQEQAEAIVPRSKNLRSAGCSARAPEAAGIFSQGGRFHI
jgi:hypothetical protein